MNINFTLVVQAFNFLIAYVILRSLLFRPAVQAITQERLQEKQLLYAITTEQDAVAKRELEKKDQWHLYQQQLALHTPDTMQQKLYVQSHLTVELVTPIIESERLASAR